jgi:predicted nucleotidyltransferase
MIAHEIQELQGLKAELEQDGFRILGVFGSFARGDYTTASDVDILYELLPGFTQKYIGFKAVARLESIKTKLKEHLGREIGLAAKNSLSETGKQYILQEVVYV